MQRTKSKILSILLSLVMLLSLLPTTALATTYNNVKVNGVSLGDGEYLTSNAATAASSSSTEPTTYVAWYKNGVLTLNNFTGKSNSGIVLQGAPAANLIIKLIGNNTITPYDTGIQGNSAAGSITITADSGSNGKLTINMPNSERSAFGINGSANSVTISGSAAVTIIATATATNQESYGIKSSKAVSILDSASVSITCKTPNSTSRSDSCNGIYSDTGVTINTDGTIQIDVHEAGNEVYSYGINSMGTLTLTKVGEMTVNWKKAGVQGAPLLPSSASFDPTAYDTHMDTTDTTNCTATYMPKVAATITSVSATVSQPVKGHPLDTSVNVHGATTYTADVMWKADGMTVNGNAQADTVYTALITLRAKAGEAFSSSLHNTKTPGGYTIEWLNSTELLLTKEFDRTNLKDATSIAIDNTTLTVAVPTAEPNMEQKAELPLTAKVNYDDGTDETVDAFWSIVDSKPEGVDIDKTTGKLTVTNKAANGTVEVKAAYNGMTATVTVNIKKDGPVESAIVLTAPTPATVAVPKNDTPNTIDLPTAAVYDQYGMPMTGTSTITYAIDGTTPTGVTLVPGSGKIKVERTAQAGEVKIVAKLGATLTSDPVIYNITRETSKVTSVRVDAPEYIMKVVPKVTEPGATNQASQQFNAAKVLDQYGQEMTGQTVTWKVADDAGNLVTGVSIDATGNLTVTNKAPAITVYVTATCSGIVSNRSKVTINKDAEKATFVEICNQVGEAPETRLLIPAATFTNSEAYTAKVYDQYGAAMTGITATWTMDPETVTGVTFVPANGSFSVDNDATTGTVNLYATIGALKSNPITFNITREESKPKLVTITGADSMNVPIVHAPGADGWEHKTYTAEVKDQYNHVISNPSVEWSVSGATGVSIDKNTGELTVSNKASAGAVTITAKSGDATDTKTVTINKAAEEISFVKITAQEGEPPVTIITCTGSQRLEYYTATAYDQYGNEKQDDVTWSLNSAVSGVSYEVSETSDNIVTLKVAPDAAEGTFKLVATSKTVNTVKGELEITVQKKNDVSSKINFNDGSLIYTGAGQKYEKAALDSSVTPGTGVKWTYTYAVKSGATGALDEAGLPKIVGTYTVTATYEDSLNIGSKSVTLNITPRKVDIPAADNTVYTYDGTAKTYKISASADYTVNNATQTNANETGYIVTVKLTDENNTTWSDGNTIVKHYTFKIMKATPTGEPSYTKITEAGKTLADAVLTIGTLKPNAATYQLQWVNDSGAPLADDTKVAKNTAYKWLFTPADTANYNTLTGSLTPYYVAPSSGGSYVPTVQKPEITIIGSGKADLSADGRTATITAAAGHELVSVVLNGKEMGKVEKLTGLKTGDKATITFRAKTDGKAEMDKMIAQKASKLTLMARSAKTAKKNIKVVVKGDLKAITDAGYTVKYKFYRSTKKSAGYKAVLTKKAPTYFNTYGKKGTMYYYKARVMIYDKDGNFVAQTALKQCKYANRLWTK